MGSLVLARRVPALDQSAGRKALFLQTSAVTAMMECDIIIMGGRRGIQEMLKLMPKLKLKELRLVIADDDVRR